MNVLQVICFIGNDIISSWSPVRCRLGCSCGLRLWFVHRRLRRIHVDVLFFRALRSSTSTFHLITSLHSTSTSTSTTFISNFHNIQHSYTNIRSDLNIIASTPAPNIEQQNADRDTTFSFGRMSERGFGVLASGPESTSHAPRHPSSTNSYSLRDSSASHVRLWRGWWRWDGETKKQKAEPRHSPH